MLQNAVDFCVYLETNWLTPAILSSWTVQARRTASSITGISEEMIPTTNNHLEGFNFVFKKRDLRMHQLRGRRLRFDLFIMIEIKTLLPNLMDRRDVQRAMALILAERKNQFCDDSAATPSESALPGYLCENAEEDKRAEAILALRGDKFQPLWDGTTLDILCPSQFDAMVQYTCTLFPPTRIRCTCVRFIQSGGLCKHLRASNHYFTANEIHLQNQFQNPFPKILIPRKEQLQDMLKVSDDEEHMFPDFFHDMNDPHGEDADKENYGEDADNENFEPDMPENEPDGAAEGESENLAFSLSLSAAASSATKRAIEEHSGQDAMRKLQEAIRYTLECYQDAQDTADGWDAEPVPLLGMEIRKEAIETLRSGMSQLKVDYDSLDWSALKGDGERNVRRRTGGEVLLPIETEKSQRRHNSHATM